MTDTAKEAGRSRDHGERLATLEERMNHVATKAWVLGGVAGGMVTAIGLALLLARLFLVAPPS